MDATAEFSSKPGSMALAEEMLRAVNQIIHSHAEAAVPPGAASAIAEDVRSFLGEMGRTQEATARLAARVRAAGGMTSSGFRNLSDWVTCAGGLTRAEGNHYGVLSQPPEGVEATTSAVRDGEITASKAARIYYWISRCAPERDTGTYPDVADFAQAAQEILLPMAKERSTTCRDIDTTGKLLSTRLDPQAHDKSERELYDERGLTLSHDRLRGGYHLVMWGPSADYETLRTGIEAFSAPPAADDRRRSGQRHYDAAMELFEFSLSHSGELPRRGGQPAQVRLTMGIDTLQGVPGAAPAISDHGVVFPLSAARVAAKNARARVIVVDPATNEILNAGRAERICPPRLRDAVLSRHSSCAWSEGCDRPVAWCEIDHKLAWWDGGETNLDNLQPLCRAHNLAKEHRRAEAERRRRLHGPLVEPEHGREPPPADSDPPQAA